MDLTLALAAIGLFLWAAGSDLARRQIPNRLVLALAALGVARIGWLLATGGGWAASSVDVAAAVLVFAGGAVAFQLRLLGGGDVKLLAAAALWLGAGTLAPFLLGTALAGAALAVLFLIWNWIGPRRLGDATHNLPYGVAIAVAGILLTAGAI